MARRISPEIDMAILAVIGLGMLYKDAAKKHGVSASYVSKLALGKKEIQFYTPREGLIDMEIADGEIHEYFVKLKAKTEQQLKIVNYILNKLGGK